MTLEEWINNNHPLQQSTTKEEIAGFLNKIERGLIRCKEEPDIDYRLIAVHKVAISIAMVALRSEGLKLKTSLGHHETLIKSLNPTIGADRDDIATLKSILYLRNIEEYGNHSVASEKEVNDGYAIVLKLRDMLLRRLKERHPELI